MHARYAGEAVRQSLLPVGTLSLLLLPTTVIAVAFGQSVFAYGFFNWPVIPAVVALSVWNLLPIAGVATLVVQAAGRWPQGLPAARVGVVVLSVVTAYGYWWLLLGPGRESASWHSGLLSVILPGYLWIVVASTAGIIFVLHKRGRVRSLQR